MIKGLVFDCFGVLIANDLQQRVDAIAAVDPEKGQQLHDIMRATDRGMLTRDEYMAQMGAVMGINPHELSSSIQNSLVKNTDLTAYIRSIKPNFKIALLSNVSGRARLEQLFDPGELDTLFDAVVASGDVGIVKPERAIYELTLSKLGIAAEESVMIDDIREYCEGAEAIGMHAIQFVSTAQATAHLEALIDSERETN